MSHCHSDVTISRREEETRDCRRIVGLIGIPNSGKSTLFNALTGGSVRVANWPGVTVDLTTGRIDDICIVDFPGIYGLTPGSIEERVAEESLLRVKPDLIAVIIDGTAPERSLYLLVQALEAFNGRVIIVVSKAAISHGLGIHIDYEGLSRELGVSIAATSVLEGVGVDRLKRLIKEESGGQGLTIDYGLLEDRINELATRHDAVEAARKLNVTSRWLAAQLVYEDQVLEKLLEEMGYTSLVDVARDVRSSIERELGLDPSLLISSSRLHVAEELAKRFIVRREPRRVYGLIDDVMLHPLLGPLAGLGILFIAFLAAFTINTGFPLNMILYFAGFETAAIWLEEHNLAGVIEALFSYIKLFIPAGEGLVYSMVEGVIDGVGLVASFIPLIAIVTAFLAILEDSGILTRIAVSMHPFLSKFGLTGKSVYPLMVAFGCNVPAVFSTRILLPHERARAIASIPFMICSARLVVLTAFTYTFFQGILLQALAATSLYMISIIASLATARLVAYIQHVKEGVEEEPPLVMDLPYMHKPSSRVVWWRVRGSLIHFIKKMFGPILVAAVIIGILLSYGPEGYVGGDIDASYGAILGSWVGRILEPLGISGSYEWVLGLSLITGSLVKEVILETIGIAVGEVHPVKAVEALTLTPLQAYAFLVFTMLYIPCIGTMTAIYSESRSLKLLALLILYMVGVAALAMYLIYGLLTLVV